MKSRLRPSVALVPLLLATASIADAEATSALSVRLVGLRSNDGKVACRLWTSAKGFPKDRGAAAQTKWCPIASKESVCTFDPIPAGSYAVACGPNEDNAR